MATSYRILGIDPGLAVTGVGLIEVGNSKSFNVVHRGVIETSHAQSLEAKLGHIFQQLEALLRSTKPSQIAYETPFVHLNIKTAFRLGQIQGVIFLLAHLHTVPIISYSPMEIKKALVGYGAASKQQVKFMVCQLLRLEGKDIGSDTTDALAVAICHIQCNYFRTIIDNTL